jgi:hypothetical protein
MPHLCNDLHLCRAPFLHTFGVHCQALVLVQTLLFFLKLGSYCRGEFCMTSGKPARSHETTEMDS